MVPSAQVRESKKATRGKTVEKRLRIGLLRFYNSRSVMTTRKELMRWALVEVHLNIIPVCPTRGGRHKIPS